MRVFYRRNIDCAALPGHAAKMSMQSARRYNPAMPAITLAPHNYAEVIALLETRNWVICCLCAAWCDVCTEFRPGFDRLALQHPDKVLLWIDIEDRADLVDEFDVDNFPTLSMQHGDNMIFYGTVEPDEKSVNRLILARTCDQATLASTMTPHRLRKKLEVLLQAES